MAAANQAGGDGLTYLVNAAGALLGACRVGSRFGDGR